MSTNQISEEVEPGLSQYALFDMRGAEGFGVPVQGHLQRLAQQ